MRLLLTNFMILLIVFQTFGQKTDDLITVKGRIIEDESGKPLPFATVAFVQFPNIDLILKGVVSDENGNFEITAPKKNYTMIIRMLGFQNFTKNIQINMPPKVDLGVIRMKTQSKELEMVTIKPLVEMKSDEITYNLMADPDRETSSLHTIIG